LSVISVADLAARLDDLTMRVVDVRWYLNAQTAGREAYDAGHIAGAVFMNLETDLSAHSGYGAPGRHPLPSVEAFRTRMEESGIATDTFVVACDDVGGSVAARLWWMLDNLGHHGGVAVLDGGLQAWVDAGQLLSAEEPRHPEGRLELAGDWSNIIARDELANRLGEVNLLDARAPERYRGEVEPVDPVAGHIPTALSAPTITNLDASGRFLAPDALRERYVQLLHGDRPTVTSCGSGVTACHNSLAMRIAGLPDPILYVGSYSDWSRSAMPVVTGADPGRPEDARR
jgi:thiosulfate/3-mercaptopyruvate sulfurtransferase